MRTHFIKLEDRIVPGKQQVDKLAKQSNKQTKSTINHGGVLLVILLIVFSCVLISYIVGSTVIIVIVRRVVGVMGVVVVGVACDIVGMGVRVVGGMVI